MFVEISKSAFEKLKARLEEMGIKYEASDCTIPGEDIKMVHLEIDGNLSPEQVTTINNQIDAIYGNDATGRENNKDMDGNGIADILEDGKGQIVEKRRRTWDDKLHTPGKEAKGFITGANMEEEVTYESR